MAAGSIRKRWLSSFLVVSVLAAPCPATAFEAGRYDPGRIGRALAAMDGVGAPRSRLVVLMSPGCSRGDEILAMVDASVGRDAVRWVPFGSRPDEDRAVARLLAAGVAGLDEFAADVGARGADPAGERQRKAFDRVLYMPLALASGRPPASPTFVLLVSGREARVWRGAPDAAVFGDILASWKSAEGHPED